MSLLSSNFLQENEKPGVIYSCHLTSRLSVNTLCCWSAGAAVPLAAALPVLLLSIELTREVLLASFATDNFHQLPLVSGEASVLGQF